MSNILADGTQLACGKTTGTGAADAEAVGMREQADKKPDRMSGGQKQQVSSGGALVGEPRLVLADEPTANLDHDTAYRILTLMKQMRDNFGTTFLFSTHDPKIMQEAEQTFMLEDGHLTTTGGAQ